MKKINTAYITKTKEFLAKTPKAKGVSVKKDSKGYFVCTHRARSSSYKSINSIPKSVIEKIEATG